MADNYIEDVIQKGDDASEVVHAVCERTWPFRKEVVVVDSSVGGLTVLKLDPESKVAVHSVGGTPNISDLERYVESLFTNLAAQSQKIGAKPVALTDTLDMSVIDIDIARTAARTMYDSAKRYGVSIINGEIAGLGDRVNTELNISGTMISEIDSKHPDGVFLKHGISYAVFPHEGKYVFANSDGVGTKIEIAERTGSHTNMHDLFAMLLDDTVKKAAWARVVSSVLERRGNFSSEGILRQRGIDLAGSMGIYFTMQSEDLGSRVNGYGYEPYNLGGTCVGLIDPADLEKQPAPQPGDYLLAVRDPKNPNFRSNGITKVRNGLREIFGDEWHSAEFQGRKVGELAGAPSTILYPAFRALLRKGLASGVYHMSGGSHKGKLAVPLAKLGLHAEISDLFEPSPLMQRLVEHYKSTQEDAYAIWPMGNDGYVATSNIGEAVVVLNRHGLEVRCVGQIAKEPGRTGLTIKLPAGEVRYPGK
jgi:phosphoribosylformylglycinamidine cyclo-ligase